MNSFRLFALLSLALAVTCLAPAAAAQPDVPPEPVPPELGPALPELGPVLPSLEYSAPVPNVILTDDCGPACHYTPCIDYRYSRRARNACDQGTINLAITVPDPRKRHCGCNVEVPVCLPACVHGDPVVDCRHGIFGRGKVVYTWCCGYKLVVTFKKTGDLIVTYVG